MKKQKVFVAPPRSRATTAWGLLKAVRRVVLEEPKRLRMSQWGYQGDSIRNLPLNKQPNCGTVGCIAGWAGMLSRRYITYGGSAARLLGLKESQVEELFLPLALCVANNEGTLQHAQETVAHLDGFMRRHEAQLRASRLVKD